MSERRWSLESAQVLLPDVRARTARAVEEAGALAEQRANLTAEAPEHADLADRIETVVSRWAREMEALGIEVKGLWLVDFDNGEGYYCWQWPEQQLAYWHGYEEGFSGRARIQ